MIGEFPCPMISEFPDPLMINEFPLMIGEFQLDIILRQTRCRLHAMVIS